MKFFFKFSSVVFSLHSIEIKFQVHSNFWHFNFNTWILICQVALTFNCRHFFHISNWIFEKSFSSEIYWRLLSNLNIKTSKLFFWAHVWSNIGIGLEDFQGQFQSSISAFLWWVEKFKIPKPISNFEVCGGTEPCNILRWVSQTFQKNDFSISKPWMKSLRYRFQIFGKSDVNLKSLNGKFKDEKIKALQKKPQYRIFEWQKMK